MRKTLYILLLVIAMPAMLWAGIPNMKFRHLDTRNGMSNAQVNCVLRDSHGLIWICTPFGLGRYDGYRFRNYYSYERDTMTLRSNRVDRMFEAYDGKLWLDHGMTYSVYDPVTEKVDRTPSIWLAKQGIKGGIEKLHIDSKKTFWIKTYNDGFYIYNPKGKKMQKLNFGYGMADFPKEFGITSFSETKDGMLMSSNQGDLMCIDGETGIVVYSDHTVKDELGQYNDYWVYVDPEGLRWVITHSPKTYIYDPQNKHWYRSLTELMKAKGIENAPEDVVVWEVCYDTKGYLWVATDHMGVLVIDFKNKEWRQFTNVKGDDTSLPDITTKHLYLDQLGRMWIATYKNGLAMNADAMTSFSSLPLGDINSVMEDDEGYIWLGMNSGGVKKVDPDTYEVLAEYRKGEMGTTSDVVVCGYKDRTGTLWFGTWEGGLLRFKNGQWTNYRVGMPGCALTTNNVWSITEDYWGNIWLGVLGGGAVRIDNRTGAQRAFTDKNTNIKTVWTNSIQRAPNGWILLGNSEYCSLINPKTMKVINMEMPHDESTFTVSAASTQVIWSKQGIIWQASASGLSAYDRKSGQFHLLDMRSGFHGSNVSAIIEDSKGSIWAATDHGVSKVTARKDEDGQWTYNVRSFNDRDGLQPGPFNQRSMCLTRKGLLLIGGQDGLDIIDTRHLSVENRKEAPIFSGLKIFDEDVMVGQELHGRVVLEESLNESRKLSLKYDDQFTIMLASNDCSIDNGKGFVYMMEGMNNNWVKISRNRPYVMYNSLRAGDYTLHVRMLNDDGTYGEEESTLDITIRPPLYRTRWMILLYMIIIAAIALYWRKWYMRRQTRMMEVQNRRRELEKQQWMNEMRLQMRQEQAAMMAGNGESEEEAHPAIELNKSITDIVVMTREFCDEFRQAHKDRDMKLNFFSPLSDLDVELDADKWRELLTILLNNSLHFTHDECNVSVGIVRNDQNKAHIQIADNGIGIKDEFKEHAFDPMVNDEGIGLDKVKAIVVAHDGDIHIEDNPGGGTIFVINLPAVDQIVEAVIIEED